MNKGKIDYETVIANILIKYFFAHESKNKMILLLILIMMVGHNNQLRISGCKCRKYKINS